MLDNGRTDHTDPIVWDFDWGDCPGATGYELYVIHRGAAIPVIDEVVNRSAYHSEAAGAAIGDANRLDWVWRVRAQLGSAWGDWSDDRPFDVEPLDTDPPPQGACVPSLIAPPANAVLDNGRRDGTEGLEWDFDWSDCPRASRYEIVVTHRGAANPAIDAMVAGSAYHHARPDSYIAGANRFDWTWQVRAFVDRAWGDWSAPRAFEVEPEDTDPPPP